MWGWPNRTTIPKQIGTDKDWSTVAAVRGGSQLFGIKADGTLWMWEYNIASPKPTQIGKDKWKAVAAGWNHTVGIKANDTLWAWGYNGQGQLGLGDKETISLPTQVGRDKWKVVAAGQNHTVGIKANDTLWAWGSNWYGQLGIGSSGEYQQVSHPQKIGFDKWKVVAAGESHTVGIKKDGTLYAWGQNDSGQLGNGKSGEGEKETIPTVVIEAPTTP